MDQIFQSQTKNNILHKKVYPAIYSEYPQLLEKTYDSTQNQTEISKKLSSSYLVKEKPEGKRYVEIDYTTIQFQNVYVMRYFLPHSLLVPFVLDTLSTQGKNDLLFNTVSKFSMCKLLTASLFGGGPCPEYYGLTCYLRTTQSNTPIISSAVFDKVEWRLTGNDSGPFFESDLAGKGGSFLHAGSEEWVRKSDIIVIQNCLNEIPGSRFSYNQQLHINMKYIVNLMKPGALMLVIERWGYEIVAKLLRDFHSVLNRFNDVQSYYSCYKKLELKNLNNNVDIPNNEIKYLRDCWLWMSNSIQFHWLAISKQ